MADTELIIEKIDSLKELFEQRFEVSDKHHDEVNEHLKKLNGQTAANTQHRIRANVYFKGLYIVLSAVIIPTVFLIFENFIK